MHNTIDYVAKTADGGKKNCLSCIWDNEKYGIGMMPPKKLLLYADGSNANGKRLQRVIETEVSKDHIEICRNADSLNRRLRRPRFDLNIAVLLASSIKDLEAILSIAKLLNDLRIILILPDREPETVSMGFKLYPRFVSYADGNFNDVAAVLGKMLDYYQYYNFKLYSN